MMKRPTTTTTPKAPTLLVTSEAGPDPVSLLIDPDDPTTYSAEAIRRAVDGASDAIGDLLGVDTTDLRDEDLDRTLTSDGCQHVRMADTPHGWDAWVVPFRTYAVATPDEPVGHTPFILARNVRDAARRWVARGDWGEAESVIVDVYEVDDEGHHTPTEVTVAITYGIADINARCRAAGISPREFWDDVMGGDRAPLPAADVHHAIARLGGGR